MNALSRVAINSAEETGLAVSVFRINQYDNASTVEYPDDEDFTNIIGPKNATLAGNTTGTPVEGKPDGKITFDSGHYQYYLSNGWRSKVIALYPQFTDASWDNTEGTVSYTIDGKTDIMTTPWGEGYKNLSVNPAVSVQPALEFEHLLTQIRVQVYAIDETAANAWGDIESITVDDQPADAVITLPDVSTSNLSTLTTVAEEEDGEIDDLYLYVTTGGTDATAAVEKENIPLQKTDQEEEQAYANLGYCMFAPLTTTVDKPLELTVTTSVGGASKVYIKKEQTYAAGTAYIITLVLKAYAIEPSTVTIKDWDENDLGEIQI